MPPGAVGTFDLDLTGKTLGETTLELGWVAEGVTWFADGPKGGGPADGYFAVKVQVVPASASGGAGGSSGAAGGGNAGAGAGWGSGGAIQAGSGGAHQTGSGGGNSGQQTELRSGDDGSCQLSPHHHPARWPAALLMLGLLGMRLRRQTRGR